MSELHTQSFLLGFVGVDTVLVGFADQHGIIIAHMFCVFLIHDPGGAYPRSKLTGYCPSLLNKSEPVGM